MAAGDRRGKLVTVITPNRAPLYVDGLVPSSTLLTTGTNKTIMVTDSKGDPAIASEVLIINSSGFTASITLTVAEAGMPQNPGQGVESDVMANPMTILSGESITVKARIISVLEANGSGSTQTGSGVRYLFTLENRN